MLYVDVGIQHFFLQEQRTTAAIKEVPQATNVKKKKKMSLKKKNLVSLFLLL
jgi:hypothetical protein